MTEMSEIMSNNSRYKEIVGKDLSSTENAKLEYCGYIDDVTHVAGTETKDDLEIYFQELYSLLTRGYSNKKLQMNGDKSAILTINNKEDDRKIKTTTESNRYIEECEVLKILGFHQNKANNMLQQVNATASKVALLWSKLKPAIPFMSESMRRMIVNSKIKSVALYGIQLMVGQNQTIIHKAEAILGRINKYMTFNHNQLSNSEALCHYLKIDTPRQEILKSNFKLTHKMIKSKKPEHQEKQNPKTQFI